MSWLATNVSGSAGGVRTVVATGRGVSVGTDVPVGWSCANAVWKACVSAALISGVGADGAAGWHAARSMIRSKKRGVRCESRSLFIAFMITEKAYLSKDTPSLRFSIAYYSLLLPSINASTFWW